MRNENGAQVDASAWKMKAKLLAIAVSRTQCTATPPLTTMGAALPQSRRPAWNHINYPGKRYCAAMRRCSPLRGQPCVMMASLQKC